MIVCKTTFYFFIFFCINFWSIPEHGHSYSRIRFDLETVDYLLGIKYLYFTYYFICWVELHMKQNKDKSGLGVWKQMSVSVNKFPLMKHKYVYVPNPTIYNLVQFMSENSNIICSTCACANDYLVTSGVSGDLLESNFETNM